MPQALHHVSTKSKLHTDIQQCWWESLYPAGHQRPTPMSFHHGAENPCTSTWTMSPSTPFQGQPARSCIWAPPCWHYWRLRDSCAELTRARHSTLGPDGLQWTGHYLTLSVTLIWMTVKRNIMAIHSKWSQDGKATKSELNFTKNKYLTDWWLMVSMLLGQKWPCPLGTGLDVIIGLDAITYWPNIATEPARHQPLSLSLGWQAIRRRVMRGRAWDPSVHTQRKNPVTERVERPLGSPAAAGRGAFMAIGHLAVLFSSENI